MVRADKKVENNPMHSRNAFGNWCAVKRDKPVLPWRNSAGARTALHLSRLRGEVGSPLRSGYVATTCSASTHLAARPGPTSTFAGNCSTQRGWATAQRGAKEQLWGFSASDGGVPGIVSSRAPRLAPWMVEASRPLA